MSINNFGYQNIPIFKINHYIPNDKKISDEKYDKNNINKFNDCYKYIFVGFRENKIKKILLKLEKGYNNITNSESQLLEKSIFNYRKKFGKIVVNNTKFIFANISEFTTIEHLMTELNYLIDKSNNLLPNNQYLWCKYSEMSYEVFIDINKYLFGIENDLNNDSKLEREIFISNLEKLLDLSYEEIIDIVISENSLKYSNKKPTLFSNKFIEFEKLYLNEEYRKLLLHCNISLSNNYYTIKNQEKINLFLNSNPFQTQELVNNSNLNSFDFLLNEILTSRGKIKDNEINLISKGNYKNIFTKPKLEYYFNNNLKYNLDSIKKNYIINNNFNINIDKNYNFEELNLYKSVNTSFKKLFFKINNSSNYEFTDLANIFKLFKLNRIIPFIRKEINGNVEIKSYLPFIKHHSVSDTIKILNFSKGIINSNYNNIVFICNIQDDMYIRCILMENSQLYVLINFNNYEKVNILKSIINVVNLIIKNIKKHTNLKTLNTVSTNHLFDNRFVNMSNIYCEDATLKFEYNFNEKIDNLYDKMNDNLSKLNNFFTIITTPVKPNIKLIFKGINQFYSKDNINRFISNFSKSKNYNLNQKDKQKLAKLIENIFFISFDDGIELLESIDFNDLKNEDKNMIFAVPLNLNIINNKIIITIENIDSFRYVNKILQVLNNLIYNISNDENIVISNDYIVKKDIKSKNKTVKVDIKDYNLDLDIVDLDEIGDLEDFDDYTLENFEDLNDELDSDIDIDLDDIEEVKKQISKKEAEKKREDTNIININIQKKFDKVKKMKYSAYMKRMRDEMDKELFDEDKRYGTLCGNDVMRQPYILTDEEINAIKNPKALTGYIKYRGNNYICPRIFDTKTKQPVSVEDYIKYNGLSPYSNGKAIPSEKRGSQVLNDEYTMIIRKPTSSEFWSNPEKEKDWPKELQKTGFDGFPGLSVIGGKSKFCRPCCFKNVPDGYKTNGDNVEHLKNFKGKLDCIKEENKEVNSKREQSFVKDRLVCENQKYIVDENSNVDNCRLGLLSNNLDILLNNYQDMFLTKDKSHLQENSNLFLRRGVFSDKQNNNFLKCVAAIKGIANFDTFKFNLVKHITPELFINLNNGNLIKIYSSNNILPNSLKKREDFKLFLSDNQYLLNLLNIDKEIIDKINNINKINDLTVLKKLTILYEIFTAYTNYIKSILSDNVYIDYTHYLDLISRQNKLIFEDGVSIFIFNKETNHIICNPYFKITNKLIILIKENNYTFTPVFQTIMKNSVMRSFGIINIGMNLKLNSEAIKYFSKSNDSNILEYINDRENKLKTLMLLHNEYCINEKNILTERLEIYNFINEYNLKIKAQVIINSPEVYYLQSENNFLIPIYPINFNKDYPVKLITEIKLIDDIKKCINFYNNLGNDNYKIKNILKKGKDIIGLKLNNDMDIPIKIIPINSINSFEKILNQNGITYLESNIFNELSFSNKIEDIQTIQLIYQDYLYSNFKYDLSININKKDNLSNKDKLYKLLFEKINYSDNLNVISSIIENLMSDNIVNSVNNNISLFPGINFYGCSKYTEKKKCNVNPFCVFENKKCVMNLSKENLKLFSYLYAQDLLNSYEERKNLFKGIYTFNHMISNRILTKPNEMISNIDDIKQDIIYMKNKKFRKNIPLNEYLNMNKIPKILDSKNISKVINELNIINNKNLETLINNLVEYTVDYIIPKNLIISTPFDKDGNLNKKMSGGPCLFPYLDTKNLKLKYDCEYNKKNILTCPVILNRDKKPQRWGYCPEKPSVTKKRLNVKEIETVGDKKKYFAGNCKFPYMINDYNLIFDCHREKLDDGVDFSWCPTKLKRGNETDIPVAASKREDIFDKKWKANLLFVSKTNKLHPEFGKVAKKGYCQVPLKVDKLSKKIKRITFEDYNPSIACNTPSKGGYTKEELYIFGTEVLKIPNVKLRDENIIFSKDKICKYINEVFYKIYEGQLSDKEGYQKDITKCKRGESYGGYSLHELRRIAINYYGLTTENSINMKKDEICDHIIKKLNIIKTEELKEKKKIKEKDIDDFNKALCNKPPNRGGYKTNKLKELSKLLNINNYKDYNKIELCGEIDRKIKKIRNKKDLGIKLTKKKKQISLYKLKTFSELNDDEINTNDNKN